MADDPTKRSSLIDITYQELHSYLAGHLEGTSPNHVSSCLQSRTTILQNLAQPFGKPSDASRKQIDSGSVKLSDDFTLKVEDTDKEFVTAISSRFDIDQVQAFLLFRSFLYNQGMPTPSSSNRDKDATLTDDLLEAITPFYYFERLSLLRTIIPLFRAWEDANDPANTVAEEFLSAIVADGSQFVEKILEEYVKKTQALPPTAFASDPRASSRWSKQNLKEQLVLVEILFWSLWAYIPCDGALVVKIFETAYATSIGTEQANATMILDDEGRQLRQDATAIWILLLLEVLELERVGTRVDFSEKRDPTLYTSSPAALAAIHELVMQNQDGRYACVYLAWAYVLSRLITVKTEMEPVAEAYKTFFNSIAPRQDRSYPGGVESLPLHMARSCLSPAAGLFETMHGLLTASPLFVTSQAWKAGSSITDPNAVGFRSVFKGLLTALVDMVPVEMIPDFDGFVEVWVALFGRSEGQSVAGICKQYWTADWKIGVGRRAVFDVARSRFPVQMRPLIRLLRAMTAFGFLETDSLATSAGSSTEDKLTDDRHLCNEHVFWYFNHLSSYTQALPVSAYGTLYEKVTERRKVLGPGLMYTTLQDVRLPGGSILPASTEGRLLSSDGGEEVLIAWQHEHSGWKLLLEILTHHVYKRRGTSYHEVSFGDRRAKVGQSIAMVALTDLGIGQDELEDEALLIDVLDLIRSVIQDDLSTAEAVLQAMESGPPVASHTSTDTDPPDLVQLTTMILEDALSRSNTLKSRTGNAHVLITSTISVLSALLALPKYSNRVWLYLRSTSSLFGSERSVGSGSAVLVADRTIGQYTMTLAVLHLVEQLFQEASSMVLVVAAELPRLQQMKEEVLLRAMRFVHSEVWVEYSTWRYVQLSDRFEIGRRVARFFTSVLEFAPPGGQDGQFVALSQAVADVFLFKAASSTVVPLVTAISSAGSTLGALTAARRFGDARRLIFLLQIQLKLVHLVLNLKLRSGISGTSLIEQVLCTRAQNGTSTSSSKSDVIEVLAGYVKDRRVGTIVPVEATWILHSLCVLSDSGTPSPVIAGHLGNPAATVASWVRIAEHPYDDPALRTAVWSLMTLALDKEPALAVNLVSGQGHVPQTPRLLVGKAGDATSSNSNTAYDTACDLLVEWKELWGLNPRLLSCVMDFLRAVWEHGLEHKIALEARRKDSTFWALFAGMISEELGPTPDYRVETVVGTENTFSSDLNDAVASYACRVQIKSQALHIVALDIKLHNHGSKPGDSTKAPSYTAVEKVLKDADTFTEQITGATVNIFDPLLHDEFSQHAAADFPTLTLPSLQAEAPTSQRELGDDFMFCLSTLHQRLQPYFKSDEARQTSTALIVREVVSINLNLSLARAQSQLTKAWPTLLGQYVVHLRGDAGVRETVLSLIGSIAGDISAETRSGQMMAAIHGDRLTLLLSLLELLWFSTDHKASEAKSFMVLVKHLPALLTNPAQYPPSCMLNRSSVPFHRTLFQVLYFCVRQCRSYLLNPKAKILTAEHRLAISSMVDTALNLTVGGLRVVFDGARSALDLDLDKDMELLVVVFEQCTRPDISPSSTYWLGRCQEHDVIGASLRVFVEHDLIGLGHLSVLQSLNRPLYTSHILAFHMTLASVPTAAEVLASAGVITAYCNNRLSPAIRAANIATTIPELPGTRSPAHSTWCAMLAVVAGVLSALGRHNHFLDQEATSFVQLYGDQITQALSWTIGDSLTLPLVEEIEQSIHLFNAIVESQPFAARSSQSGNTEPILRAFAGKALVLLQQLNYALTHPNHLVSLVEAVTMEERTQLERDASESLSNTVDLTKRPFLTRLIHRLFGLSGSVLSTLASIGGAELVLTGDHEDWPLSKALVVPHSKVVLSEPASTGTLLELCNCALDVLRRLSAQPAAGQAITVAGPRGEKPLDVGESVVAARRTLETAALFAVTQLALWAAKPDADEPLTNDMDADEIDAAERSFTASSSPERRLTLSSSRITSAPEPRKSSVSANERLRMGMTNEIAADLLGLLNKARPVLQKLDEGAKDGKSVDLFRVLAFFLQEHVAMS